MEFFDFDGERKWSRLSAQERERKDRGQGLLKNYESEGDVFSTMTMAVHATSTAALFR